MENVTLDVVYKEVKDLKSDMTYLKHVLEEEYELSDWAKKELKKARKTPESEYANIDDVM